MNIIEIKNLNFSYSKSNPTLKNINLTIRKGEWVSILGHNGSGKSTLSKLLVGLLKADSGSITVDNILLAEDTVFDIRKKVGIVFQNPENQFVGVTVKDDISFGMENLSVDRKTMLERIDHLSKKTQVYDFLEKQPHNLSGGQKQRVAITGILAMNTDIIIFDEATSMLDPKGRDELMGIIKKLHNEGVTIITITHDMTETLNSDRIIILKNGEILKIGETPVIIRDEEVLKQSNLELITPLRILFGLKNKNVLSKEIEDKLWQLSLKK